MEVQAIKTNCLSGTEHPIMIEVDITTEYDGNLWIKIIKGCVTGYESRKLKDCGNQSWLACMGTKERWDKLFIPLESMQQIWAYYKDLLGE